MIWKIVLVKVYFTDLSDYKIRPVFIFKKYDEQDYMFLPLSSNINRNWIVINNSSLISWKLDKESIIVIPKIWIIHKTLIIQEFWELKQEIIDKISNKLCVEFWCLK